MLPLHCNRGREPAGCLTVEGNPRVLRRIFKLDPQGLHFANKNEGFAHYLRVAKQTRAATSRANALQAGIHVKVGTVSEPAWTDTSPVQATGVGAVTDPSEKAQIATTLEHIAASRLPEAACHSLAHLLSSAPPSSSFRPGLLEDLRRRLLGRF